ncbi:MAG: ferritin-like protein [Flavobacteriales bacterium]|nr:ferritin-like protein [Flavobacteriales bacterium]
MSPTTKTLHHENDLFANLQTAIELEHSTIPPYLTAMFTINSETNPDAFHAIRGVVMEEMLHMTLASNVLIAIGGHPAIDIPKFIPEYPVELDFTERDFEVGLVKFSKDSLQIFLDIEYPGEQKVPELEEDLEITRTTEIVIPGNTIGEFYELVEKQLIEMCDDLGEKNVFVGNPKHQIGPEHYYGGGGEIIRVTDLETASLAIKIIVDQGEGAPGSIWDDDEMFGQDKEVAHYFRFNEIMQERYYKEGDLPSEPPTGPPLPVKWNAVKNMVDNPRAEDFPEGSLAKEKAEEFNQLYSAFLHTLHDCFNGHPNDMRNAIGTMWQMKYLAEELLNIEVPGTGGKVAGPTFQFVHKEHRVHVVKKHIVSPHH